MSRTAIITNMPSGYQSELFSALAEREDCDPHVLFLRRMTPGRQWTRFRENDYPHSFVKEIRIHQHFYLNAGFFRTLRAIDPELIIVCQYAGISMQLAMYYATLRGIPWVFWSERPGVEHTELPIFETDFLRRTFRSIALRPVRSWPKEIWAIGSRAQKDYEQRSTVPCHNLPYHSDLSRFFAIDRSRRPRGPIRFLYSGKLNERKGVDLIGPAVTRMVADGKDFSITFMGDGPLKGDVNDLQSAFPKHVKYVGFKEMDETTEVLANHDVLLCPSRYDGWGLVVPEGLAAGMPVIASDKTGAAIDMLVDDKNGLLIDSNSSEAIERGMTRMLEMRQKMGTLRRHARTTAKGYCHTEGARKMAQLIQGALKP